MAAFAFNGVTSGSTGVPFNPATDVLNLTYTQGFDTTGIQTDSTGTNVIVTTALGGTFLLVGVVLEQLDDANIVHTFGDFDIGNNGNNSLTGTIVLGLAGNDTINGLAGSNDFLHGNAGNDDIDGNGGMDRIRGGQGNDTIYGFGTGSVVHGDRGEDWISADDDAEFTTIFGGNKVPFDPLDGADTIDGSNGNDIIFGMGGNDDLDGDGGDDYIRGGRGDDDIEGDDGDDILGGDLGNDWIQGWNGADTMTGGEGNDTFDFVWGPPGTSAIANLSLESISEDAEGISAANFGLPQLGMLDSITDLDLGGDGVDRVDSLVFSGWDDGSGDANTLMNVSANNMADLISAFHTFVGGDDDDQALLIYVNGGAFEGRQFLLVSTFNDAGPQDPEFALQVTGVVGTFDDGDISN